MACVVEMERSCGQSVRVEVSGSIFNNNVDPSTSHKRMELVVRDDPGKQNHLLYVLNPVTQEVLQSNKVNLQVTTVMQRIKERRYRELATESAWHSGGSLR